jgi:hypothetical protein
MAISKLAVIAVFVLSFQAAWNPPSTGTVARKN